MTLFLERHPLTRFTFFLIVILLMSACSSRSAGGNRNANRAGANSNANSESQDAPITVTVGKSEARNVSAVIQATGSLQAQETSDVAPKVAGKVSNVYVNVGDFVGAGKVSPAFFNSSAFSFLFTAAIASSSLSSAPSAAAK